MTYHNFEKEVMDLISDKLPKGHSANIKPIGKNNGIILHGLIINNGRSNISPTIYLDYYYDEYKKGFSIEDLADQIITQYKKFSIEEDFDITVFTDYEKCKKNISYKLINYEKNVELLKDVPHIVYLDLAIVFYCLLQSDDIESSSILIKNSHMDLWNVNVNDLFDVASSNTPKLLQSDIRTLSDIVRELLEKRRESDEFGNTDTLDVPFEIPSDIESPMYVLTNKIKLYGACCILYKHLLAEFATKMEKDLYIIPSSIHEVLLIPESEEYDKDYLTSLVKEVNATQLEPEDVLSDHVYYYSRKDDAITY
ncbi:MAG: DUF5688 family protein [Lachnospiraceae bacterium]|nr:DUF5688 family protein [Lachnospiraceae bacterium]